MENIENLIQSAESLIARAELSLSQMCIEEGFGTPFCKKLQDMAIRCKEAAKIDQNSQRAKYLKELANDLADLER